ncbi:MAG: hypothetical protein MSC30_13795 [Gaiellaceae bacterium MAG52_C11]|nr:hypothetical protein [Candidatus Gaiellasilicea maunaloa]
MQFALCVARSCRAEDVEVRLVLCVDGVSQDADLFWCLDVPQALEEVRALDELCAWELADERLPVRDSEHFATPILPSANPRSRRMPARSRYGSSAYSVNSRMSSTQVARRASGAAIRLTISVATGPGNRATIAPRGLWAKS